MRGIPTAVPLALVGGFVLTLSTARADTLDAPAEVMAQANGSFSYACTFHKGAGTDRLAGHMWSGEANVQGGLVADCFCADFCPVFGPGSTFTFQVQGQLTNPGIPGRVTENLSLCMSAGASASTNIRPYSVTGAPPLTEGDGRFWNEPNPFSTRTTFHYRLAEPGPVSLDIYDLSGRRVARVVDAVLPAGPQEATWDLRAQSEIRQAGGVFFARLSVPGAVRHLPLILAR